MSNTQVKEFSTLLLQFLDNVYILCPNTILSNNKTIVNSFIKNNPELLIKFFVKNFLKYKNDLDQDPSTFLATHDLSADINTVGNMIDIKGFDLSQIFVFQQIWGTLSTDNKNIIISYMKYLFQLAELYFMNS